MDKIDVFEKHAHRYEEWFEKNKYAYQSELKAIKRLLPQTGIGIEIGVGTGRFAKPLGIKVGVEPSSQMIKIAKKRGIKVIKGVAENLPVADSSFDFVLMVTTICFLEDIEAALKETYRILKPNGFLVIGFVDRDSPLGKLYQQRKEKSVFYKEATFYSVKEVVSYLKGAGFNNFAFAQTLFHIPSKLQSIDTVKEGYGEGSFVVIRASKISAAPVQ